MKKKIFSILLVAALLLSTFSINVFAEETDQFDQDMLSEQLLLDADDLSGIQDENNEQSVVDSGKCGNDLTWTLDYAGVLIISGTGDMYDYEGNGSPWKDPNDYMNTGNPVRSVVIEDGVTGIGNCAFWNCSKMTSIVIPDSVTRIGEEAFMACSGLTKIIIPDSVTRIENDTFDYCTSLASVTLPKRLTYIGQSAFLSCYDLTNITIPESITRIESATFWNTGLTSIIIPDGVTRIDELAFEACYALKSITIPDSVTYIGREAFYECNNLKNVKFIGTKEKWYKIEICRANDPLKNAAINYYYFNDVPKSHPYQAAVYWAREEGIAAGYSGAKTGLFGVKDDITRGQVVTFLWRAAGKPEPNKKTQTFKDVPVKHAYFRAIQWAVEQGITGGYTGSKKGYFGPADSCTRGQIATFLWRYAGYPAPAGKKQTFKDVPVKHSFYKAIQWASEQGITAGYKNGKFGVNDTCTRGQSVTFLYRLLG